MAQACQGITGLYGRSPGTRLGLLGTVILAGFLLVGIAAPLIAPYEPHTQVGTPFEGPGWAHPLGTNDVGHDILSEIIFGGRISLAVGVFAALAATTLGTLVALVAGYSRGAADSLLMRGTDVALALPFLPLVIVLGVFLGPGLATEVLVISAVLWAGTARVLRSKVLTLRERGYVQAARAMGGSPPHVLLRHILPGISPLIIPQFVRAANTAILLESSLSFLGLGDPTNKSWGTTLFYASARSAFLTDAWLWWVLPAGLCIALVVVSFAFIGFALEEWMRPTLIPGKPLRRLRPLTDPGATGSVINEGVSLLEVRNLTAVYATSQGEARAVDDVSFTVERGQVLGIVGESGCGKSTLAASLLRLVKPPGQVVSGQILLEGQDIYDLSPAALRRLRSARLAYIPQAAMNALNPVVSVVDQIAEAILLHQPLGNRAARDRAVALLDTVGIRPERARSYPHELSGGMRQRVFVAMALANDPVLVIADEPTTGLDVITQSGIVQLLCGLRARLGLSMIFISHDLSVVMRVSDHLAVMYDGKFVEEGPVRMVATNPAHSYTRKLLQAIPRLSRSAPEAGNVAESTPGCFMSTSPLIAKGGPIEFS